MQEQHFDIVIIGGGQVGMSLACALTTLELRIAVVEAVAPEIHQQADFDSRSLALSWSSRNIFEGMGVWSALEPAAAAIEKIHVSQQGSFGHSLLDSKDEHLPAMGYVVENAQLNQALFEHMQAQKTISYFCPANVFRLQQQPMSISVDIEQQDQIISLKSRLLVAADGASSRTVDLLGLQRKLKNYGQYAVISNVSTEYDHQQVAYERFLKSGPMALLPLSKQRCALVWSVAENRLAEVLALDSQQFAQTLQENFSWRLGAFTRIGERSRYPLQGMRLDNMIQQRAVVIGNAAHTLHPVAGQGLNLGLRDVALLAEKIARYCDDPGDQKMLAEFQQQRQKDIDSTQAWTNALLRLFSHPEALFKWGRSGGLLALDLLPPIKHRLARQGMGFQGKMSRLACGLPLLQKAGLESEHV